MITPEKTIDRYQWWGLVVVPQMTDGELFYHHYRPVLSFEVVRAKKIEPPYTYRYEKTTRRSLS